MEQSQSSDPKMTAEQVRTWLRDWVMRTTGLPEEDVTDDKAMETFGLSSRDVVVLSGELENLLDVTLDATIAYEYPTIRGLAQRLIDGEPERSNIKRCGYGSPFPRRRKHRGDVEAARRGPRWHR